MHRTLDIYYTLYIHGTFDIYYTLYIYYTAIKSILEKIEIEINKIMK